MSCPRLFLLSPATAHGAKARVLLQDPPRTPAATWLRSSDGMPLAAVFTYLSGLYFTGKLAYARAFANISPPLEGVYVLTMSDGLLSPAAPVSADMLRRFAAAADGSADGRDRLIQSARTIAAALGEAPCEVVFLGSVHSSKYTELLEPVFGDRLRFPRELVRRGQLERGAILLERATARRELDYITLDEVRAMLARPRRARAER